MTVRKRFERWVGVTMSESGEKDVKRCDSKFGGISDRTGFARVIGGNEELW
eukprot:CAMPEP_0185743218 /NCGR_PEP_ID=MMETSP1174-20130828/875_1 /TAXON_ID=35687 /ORGANISM="Dictyocha speculum, Strain CCMP1381" /LENGTH=50 /DNA_ID=CAMNT_0028415745 /DNA_START=308 /DNA_END=457 /DNA_ORIENTATION=+